MSMHPYTSLDEGAFWSTAVAKRNMFDIDGLWDPKFAIARNHPVATFGSCFAQHIGRALRRRGFHWQVTESAPEGLSAANAAKYNYGIFSARTGNIYTTSLLKQWVGWATGAAAVPKEVWWRDGRCYDPFRPNIEPDGFASAEEMLASRELAIECFLRGLKEARVFVFTLGLTESWFNAEHGYEYPMCPGTVAGDFDASRHRFVNQIYPDIRKSLLESMRAILNVNPAIKFLLTVSPVPLTATMSGRHVLVATMESKSTLRAVAGQMASQYPFVDYFPSYEIINAPTYRGTFFEPNQRGVNAAGVEHVMDQFFRCLDRKFPLAPARAAAAVLAEDARSAADEDLVCEEELLGAFAKP